MRRWRWGGLLEGLRLQTSHMVFVWTQARGPPGCWSHSLSSLAAAFMALCTRLAAAWLRPCREQMGHCGCLYEESGSRT